MEEGLDGRGRRRRVGHAGLQLAGHLGVDEGVELEEVEQPPAPQGRESGCLNRLEVPAAALYVQDLILEADDVALSNLDRSVAAAVEDERPIPA